MNTQVIKIDSKEIVKEQLYEIASVLKSDGLIVYPTETFYGLGANCFSEKAIDKIYKIKDRKKHKPLSVVISDIEMMNLIVSSIPPFFNEITAEFWPGALTLILEANPKVPAVLCGSDKTIGVRIPGHDWLRELIRTVGFPLIATSANSSGEKELSDFHSVHDLFMGRVDLLVDGGLTPGNHPSTVLDLSKGKPRILREGALSANEIQKFY